MERMTNVTTQDAERLIVGALADPGKVVPRIMDFIPPRWDGDSPDVEPLHLWQARAVIAALTATGETDNG